MPASDLLWSSAQGQAFQLYGTKRKSSSCDQEECHMTDVSMDGSGDCKRRCLERIEPEGLEVNHNDPQLNSLQHTHTFTQTQIMPSFPHKLEQVQESSITMASSPPQRFISVQQYYGGPQFCQVETTPHEVDKYPAHSTAETNMVMDLCDETYSVITESPPSAREMEEAHNLMASDFTPNQQQYRNNSLAFCAPNCIVDGPSPTSRVRCYCKPNWDGMMDARPYVSDYY